MRLPHSFQLCMIMADSAWECTQGKLKKGLKVVKFKSQFLCSFLQKICKCNALKLSDSLIQEILAHAKKDLRTFQCQLKTGISETEKTFHLEIKLHASQLLHPHCWARKYKALSNRIDQTFRLDLLERDASFTFCPLHFLVTNCIWRTHNKESQPIV